MSAQDEFSEPSRTLILHAVPATLADLEALTARARELGMGGDAAVTIRGLAGSISIKEADDK